jgi:regulator of replication initiation timing
MPSTDDLSAKLDRLLRENAAVREASEELVREAGRLKAENEKEQARERHKKPRAKGR